jgi:A/G-specific adenine glycosylase
VTDLKRKSQPPLSDLLFFRKKLKAWHRGNRRDFPWRRTTNPYELLIAELMLRRTRASQVVAVYERFLASFPSPKALADASAQKVAELLKPLGLTWRVPAFQQVAKQIVTSEGGMVPLERRKLLDLPGVGDYVADAVLCFAKSEPVAIVDTNTVRIAGRYLGFEFGPESRRKPAVKSSVALLFDRKAPRESNFALLDFAASICRAGRPLCDECPVAPGCVWGRAVLMARPHQTRR